MYWSGQITMSAPTKVLVPTVKHMCCPRLSSYRCEERFHHCLLIIFRSLNPSSSQQFIVTTTIPFIKVWREYLQHILIFLMVPHKKPPMTCMMYVTSSVVSRHLDNEVWLLRSNSQPAERSSCKAAAPFHHLSLQQTHQVKKIVIFATSLQYWMIAWYLVRVRYYR